MSLLQKREFHPFEAAGQKFLYLVPSAAVFALDDCSAAVLDELDRGSRDVQTVAQALTDRFDPEAVTASIGELRRVRAVAETAAAPPPKIVPLKPVPLQT